MCPAACDDLLPNHVGFSAWYAGDYVIALVVMVAMVVFAFYTSLAGQPLFSASLPDD